MFEKFFPQKNITKTIEKNSPVEVIVMNGQKEILSPQNLKEISRIVEKGEKVFYTLDEVSTISEEPKFIPDLKDCTGIAVFGRSHSGKILSFATHTSTPARFDMTETARIGVQRSEYKNIGIAPIDDLRKSMFDMNDPVKRSTEYDLKVIQKLEDMKKLCESGTIEAFVYGGHTQRALAAGDQRKSVSEKVKKESEINYERSIDLQKSIITMNLGIEPKIAHLPLTVFDARQPWGTNVYVDTANKKLYVGIMQDQKEK